MLFRSVGGVAAEDLRDLVVVELGAGAERILSGEDGREREVVGVGGQQVGVARLVGVVRNLHSHRVERPEARPRDVAGILRRERPQSRRIERIGQVGVGKEAEITLAHVAAVTRGAGIFAAQPRHDVPMPLFQRRGGVGGHSCGGHCKGSVRPCQQLTAERADERSTNSMNITYTQNGDYLIPNIVIRKTKPLGHYGRLRKAYLEMHRPILFNELVLSDKLFEHCAEIDEAARNRMELIVPELAKQYGVTEQLKAENQMEWVRQMNACKAQAEEIVKAELIYD